MKAQDLMAFLRSKGIKASVQRVKILDYMRHSHDHPCVNKIYEDLHRDFPTLSRATVYNTINLFIDKKLVVPILVDKSEARYDWARRRHAHFYCTNCHKIFDLPEESFAEVELEPGFVAQEWRLDVQGLCRDCAVVEPLP